MFGIVSWPALRKVTTRSELLASFWSSGNVASTTSTGKLPSGSFSSWRSPPPHPAMTEQAQLLQRSSPSKPGEHTTRTALPAPVRANVRFPLADPIRMA